MELPKQFEIEFIRKKQMAQDAYSFYFARPVDLNFLPGQYLRMKIPHNSPDVRGDSRQFSIASSPTEKDHIRITTRIVQSTYKLALAGLVPGTKVEVVAPYGKFVFDEKDARHHVFLAGGIGITPFRPMIKYAIDNNLSTPMTLITSFRHTEDIVYGQELREMDKQHDWLSLVETVTRPEESKETWAGLTGRINDNLIKKYIPDLQGSVFFISGPSAMVDALSETVKSLSIPPENIKLEKFIGY